MREFCAQEGKEGHATRNSITPRRRRRRLSISQFIALRRILAAVTYPEKAQILARISEARLRFRRNRGALDWLDSREKRVAVEAARTEKTDGYAHPALKRISLKRNAYSRRSPEAKTQFHSLAF